MSAAIAALIIVGVGLVLTLAGFFGPEDGGTLELVGLVVLGLGLWALGKTSGIDLRND